ncbi:hypothetical protein ACF1B0_04240 [Streptomyces anandii]|uniref:hypothetical protein n=1 Tax=Streptomyces anandii TaxID=285454 RepID=UPI0036FE8D70
MAVASQAFGARRQDGPGQVHPGRGGEGAGRRLPLLRGADLSQPGARLRLLEQTVCRGQFTAGRVRFVPPRMQPPEGEPRATLLQRSGRPRRREVSP